MPDPRLRKGVASFAFAFQVISPGGCGYHEEGQWYDVISRSTGGDCRVRIPILTYMGRTTLHCHYLEHEGQGIQKIPPACHLSIMGGGIFIVPIRARTNLLCCSVADAGTMGWHNVVNGPPIDFSYLPEIPTSTVPRDVQDRPSFC